MSGERCNEWLNKLFGLGSVESARELELLQKLKQMLCMQYPVHADPKVCSVTVV